MPTLLPSSNDNLTVAVDYLHANTEYVGFRAGHGSLVKFMAMRAF